MTGSASGDAVADAASWEPASLWTTGENRDTRVSMKLEQLLTHWSPPQPPTERIELILFAVGMLLGMLWVWLEYA